MRRFLLLFALSSTLFASKEGCNIFKQNSHPQETQLSSIEKKSEPQSISKKFLKITPKLTSVMTLHKGEEVVIKREAQKDLKSCPPFCIQPMKIEGVRTVGELETLAFIEKKKKNSLRLLLDVRENSEYQKATIPSAINLPRSMLSQKSPYYTKVLKLLGAKQINEKWHFKEAHTLLVFGESSLSDEARLVIEHLLNLNYPKEKILYYRAGMNGWLNSGLTTY